MQGKKDMTAVLNPADLRTWLQMVIERMDAHRNTIPAFSMACKQSKCPSLAAADSTFIPSLRPGVRLASGIHTNSEETKGGGKVRKERTNESMPTSVPP